MSGLFDVIGMMDETVLRNMVSDSKIVTPKKAKKIIVTFAFLCPPSLRFLCAAMMINHHLMGTHTNEIH